MRYVKTGKTRWTAEEKAKRAANRAVALRAGHEQRIALATESPKLIELERRARRSFEAAMDLRNRCEPDSINWWRCHEQAQAWHEIASLLCDAKRDGSQENANEARGN